MPADPGSASLLGYIPSENLGEGYRERLGWGRAEDWQRTEDQTGRGSDESRQGAGSLPSQIKFNVPDGAPSQSIATDTEAASCGLFNTINPSFKISAELTVPCLFQGGKIRVL